MLLRTPLTVKRVLLLRNWNWLNKQKRGLISRLWEKLWDSAPTVWGPVFTESPLRGLHFLVLSLSFAVVDWAPHQLAQLGWTVIPGIVLWSEMQGLVGRQQPHSDHMASAGVKSPSPKKGRCCFQKDGGGVSCCNAWNICQINVLSKFYTKPELIFKPGSQHGKVEGTLGWNLEARMCTPALTSTYHVALAALFKL